MLKSAFFCFAVGSLIPVFSPAQLTTDTARTGGPFDAHHFLWFTGHWSNTKKNMFIVDSHQPASSSPGAAGGSAAVNGDPGDNNPVGGGSINVDPDGSIHLSNGNIDGWNKKINDALKSQDQYLQELNSPANNLEPASKNLNDILRPDAVAARQQLESYKIDPKEDMLGQGKQSSQSASRSPYDLVGDYCRKVRSDYDMVIEYYKSHVKGHSNDLNVPPPPAFEYNCYACDSNMRKVYDTTIEHYVRDFAHPEDSILSKGYSILHNLALIGIEADKGMDPEAYENLFKKNKADPSRSAPCAYIDLTGLSNALYGIAHHLYLRADKLVQTNRNNFRASEAIIRTYVTIARQMILLTGNTGMEDEIFPTLATLLAKDIDFYYDAFRKDDWRQIANIPFMLDLIRNNGLIGGGGDGAFFKEYFSKLLKIWNGFEMSIEMDIKVGKQDAYRLAHLKGKCHIIPAFQQDSNQCYKWVVADEDRQDINGFDLPKMLQAIDCQLLANDIISPPGAPKITYTGTRKYVAVLESLAMDYCNPGHDTIMLSGFTPNPASAGTWQFPYSYSQNLGVNGLEEFFEDVNAKKKLADNGDAKKSEDDMKQQGEQIRKEMEALKNQMAGSNASANFEKMMELKNKAMSLSTTPSTGKMLYVDFNLPVKNNDPVLVDAKFNAKDINPKEGEVIIYGTYSIHIENDGNGTGKPAASANTQGSSGKH